MHVRDKRSPEFTVTRSLMKLFQTGSATVVSDCMNFFHFLPLNQTTDIRTAAGGDRKRMLDPSFLGAIQ